MNNENCPKCLAIHKLEVSCRPVSITRVNKLTVNMTYFCSCGYGFDRLQYKEEK